MDFSDDVLDTITSEKLAVSHINSLRSALQQEKERVVAHKEYIDSLEKDKELFLLESHKKTIELELESIKQQLLLLCCGNSYNPSVIVDHLTNELLPKLNDEALLLFVLVKTGHSWTIVPSSDSNSHSNSISYGNSNNDSNNNSNSEWTTYHSVKQFQSAVIDDLVNSHSQSYVNLHYDIAISANSGNSGNSNCLSGVFKPLQSALPTDAVGFLQRSCSYDSSSNNNSYCVSEKDDVLLIVSPGVASCCWLILFPTATNLNTSYSNSNSYNNSNSNSNNNSSMRSARLSLANELSHLHDAPTYDNQGTGHNSNNNAWESWEQIFSLTSELVMSSLLNLFRLRKQLVQSSREKLQHCILQQLSCAKNSYSGNTNNHDSHSASSGRKKTNYYETRKQNELVWEGLANTVNEYIDSYIASLYGQKSGVLVSSTVLTLVNGRTVSSYAVASTHELVELVGKVNGRGNSTLAESINSNSIFELRVSSNKTDILRILEDIGEVKLLNNSAAIGTTRDVQNYTVISVPITACNTTVTSPPVSACLVVGLAAVGSSPSPRGHISSSFNKQQNVVDCIQADLKDIFPQGLPCSSILAFLVDRDLQPLTKTDIPFQRVGGAAAKRGRKRTGKQRGRSRSNSRSSYRTRSRSRSPSLASRDDQSDRYQQSVGRSKEVMFDEDVLHINLCCSNNIAEGNKALLAGQWELTDYEETLYVPPIGSSPEIDGIFVKYVASLSALLNCDWTCAVAQVQTPSVVQDIGEVSPPFDIASMYLTIASNGYYRLSDLDNLSSMRVLHQLFDQNSVEGQPQSPISYGTSRYNSNKGSDDDISTDSDQADFRLKRVAEVVGDYCCFVVDLVKALDVINQDGHCDGSHLHPSEYMPLLDELNSDHNYSVAALEKMHNTLMLKITLLPHDASSDTPKSPKSSQSIVIIAGRSWHKFNMVAIKTVSLELAQLMSYAYDFKLSNLQTKTIQKLQQEAEAQQRRSTELIESEKSIATNKDRQLKVLDEQQQLLYHGLVSLYQLLSRNKITLSPPKRNIHWKDEGGSKSPVTCPVADAIDAFDVSSNENVAKENRSGKGEK